jgi:hypothetical protein
VELRQELFARREPRESPQTVEETPESQSLTLLREGLRGPYSGRGEACGVGYSEANPKEKQVDREHVRSVVNQLVEAEFDQTQAESRLKRFTESIDPPPRPPSEFKDLQSFLDFYEEKQGREDEEQSLRAQLDSAKGAYNQAESTLRGMMPDNTPLHYDYEGEREELAGVRFTIVNQNFGGGQRRISISSTGLPSQ